MRWEGFVVAAGFFVAMLLLRNVLGPKTTDKPASRRLRDTPTDYRHPVLFWLLGGGAFGAGMYGWGQTSVTGALATGVLWGLFMYVAMVRYPRWKQRRQAPATKVDAGFS